MIKRKHTLLEISNKVDNLDTNFIPQNTTYYIKLDGTGDFTSIDDALNFLNGKYSNGIVKLQLGEGEFPITKIKMDAQSYNIPILELRGLGNSSVILTNLTEDYGNAITVDNFMHVRFTSFVLKNPNGTRSTNYRGIVVANGSVGFIFDVKTIGCGEAIMAEDGGNIVLMDISIEKSIKGIVAANGCIYGKWGSHYTFNDVDYLLNSDNGGHISLSYTYNNYYSFTNVSHTSNNGNGSATTLGYVRHPF